MIAQGTVDFWHEMKGFGFISGEDGKSYFMHQTGLGRSSPVPCAGDKVRFSIEEGDRGPKAVNVAAAPEEAEEPEEEEGVEDSTSAQLYMAAVQGLCRELAKHIADDPEFLMNVEWRELEKVLASSWRPWALRSH